MRVYIAGKISGLDHDKAYEKFDEAETMLQAIGLKAINPMKGGDWSLSWEKQMVRCVDLLMHCDAILMLDNWIESRGARIEKYIADERRIMVFHQGSFKAKSESINRIQEAIKEVMGINFEAYTCKKERHNNTFYARMIFANHLTKYDSASPSDIAAMLNRDSTTILRYLKNYEGEIKYNREFREIVKSVSFFLSR